MYQPQDLSGSAPFASDLETQIAVLTRELSEARERIEKLGEFTRKINGTTDLGEIVDHIIAYMKTTFGLEGSMLHVVDERAGLLRFFRSSYREFHTPEQRQFMRQFHIAMGPAGGTLWKIVEKGKPVYLPRLIATNDPADPINVLMRDDFRVESGVIVPLIVQERPVGLLMFTTFDRKIQLSRPELAAIYRFCEQIAGAVYSSAILRNLQEERAAAEKARREIETLNAVSKKINESGDLSEVLRQCEEYFASFGLDYMLLMLVDDEARELFAYPYSTYDLPPEVVAWARRLRVPLRADSGSLYLTYRRKKTLYRDNLDKRGFPLDEELRDRLKLRSVLQIPLIVRERVIGILSVSNRKNPTRLGEATVLRMTQFCEQIAGAVYRSSLLNEVRQEREKSDRLLLNILPPAVAEELKKRGRVEPVAYEDATVLFTDFVGFTKIASTIAPGDLIRELDGCFTQFDEVATRNRLEKLKTIGDAYMCAGGLPARNRTHPVDACLAALEFRNFMRQMREIKSQVGVEFWSLRIGLHTGPVTAGIVGKNKFAYDIWGDTVNIASRMESSGEPDRINISGATYRQVRDFFDCEYRGMVEAKGKGRVDMYFLEGLKSELTMPTDPRVPNGRFFERYAGLGEN